MQVESRASSRFGQELRRRREERGLSLGGLASLVHYSRGYVGKVETGDKPPTVGLARRCDEALEADGNLLKLISEEGLPRFAQLPAAAATFVGRGELLERLTPVLIGCSHAGAPKVAAIDGPPGMGKTAFALRLAHEVKEHFPDGQLFVNLHGHSQEHAPARPESVLEEFLVTLGVQAGQVPDGAERRAALFRSMVDGKQVLVVLDNALDTQQVEPLLPASSACGVILTSRNRLGRIEVPQEHRATLGPMSDAEATTLLCSIVGAERAGKEPAAVAALAKHCGHMPLALRLAAERVALSPNRGVNDLARELAAEKDRLDFLSTDDSPQVRTVISWSYRDLEPDAAHLFRLLGLHPGPHASVEAAAALADIPPTRARHLLDRLVARHLVWAAANDRYQLHDLLRVYASERAAAEHSDADLRAAKQRLVDWYLRTAYEANGLLAPQRPNPELPAARFDIPLPRLADYDEALLWCERELPNLVAITRLAVEIRDHETGWKLPAGLWNYFFLRKRWSAWVASHQDGLEGARASGDLLGEAWLLNNIGVAYRELRRYDEAEEHLDRALTIRRGIRDQVGEAWTLTALGFLANDRRRFESAATRFRQALALRALIAENESDTVAIIGNLHGQSIALANLGVALTELGDHDNALESLHQALAIARRIDDRHGESYTLIKLSDTYRKQHRIEEALAASQDAADIRREVGDRWGEAEVLQHRGHALLDGGFVEQAADAWRGAEEIFDELGDPRADDVRGDLAKIGLHGS